MGRQELDYIGIKGAGGINQQADLADPFSQLLDARNVWAPDGYIVQRPGYQGVSTFGTTTTTLSAGVFSVVKESPVGTFTTTTTISNADQLSTGERWYLGNVSLSVLSGAESQRNFTAIQVGPVTALNANEATVKLEYWNGTEWTWLRFIEHDSTSSPVGLQVDRHLKTLYPSFRFPPPVDMETTTINGLLRRWVRFTIESPAYSLSNPVTVTGLSTIAGIPNSTVGVGYLAVVQFNTAKRYIIQTTQESPAAVYYFNSGIPGWVDPSGQVYTASFLYDEVFEPPTLAAVPQFAEAYFAYGHHVTAHKASPSSTDDINVLVESDPLIVGSGARYSTDDLPQLASWPQAKFIEFYRGELWCAGIKDEPHLVRWSAPSPYYRVWPTVNGEWIEDNDNSPITGIKGFQEDLHVFKQDSIWRMIDAGIINGLQTYAPRKVVDGVGCVANGTIQEIRGRLIFLAEDGVYAYDGSPNIQKLSDRVKDTISHIVPGYTKYSVAVNWKSKGLYLLAINTGRLAQDDENYPRKACNDTVLVYDYKNDAWWIWELYTDVAQFVLDEDGSDHEILYFTNVYGHLYEFNIGMTDHGGTITSSITSHRLLQSPMSKTLRNAEVTATNLTREVQIEVLANDLADGEGVTGTIELLNASDAVAEKEYGVMTFGVDKWTYERDRIRALRFYTSAEGQWFNVKLTHSEKNTPFSLTELRVGIVALGTRD